MHIAFTAKMELKEYRGMIMHFWLSNPINLFLIALGFILLIVATLLHVRDCSPYIYHPTVILGCYLLGARPAYVWTSCEKIYNSAKVLTHESDYVLTDEKFYTKGNGHEQHLDWNYFYAISNRKDSIVLYQNIGVVNIVLKKWLTKEQRLELINFLTEKGYIKSKGETSVK